MFVFSVRQLKTSSRAVEGKGGINKNTEEGGGGVIYNYFLILKKREGTGPCRQTVVGTLGLGQDATGWVIRALQLQGDPAPR